MKLSDIDKDLAEALYHKNISPSLGGDPEFFIANKRGKVLNADAFLPGKEDPVLVHVVHGDEPSRVFFDGIQAEMAPTHNICREYFTYNIKACWEEVLRRIPNDHKIVLKPAVKIQKSVIEGADPEARRFGCAPDFNAYTLTTNTPEMDASRHPFRYAGGHLHFGAVRAINFGENDPIFKMALTEEGHIKLIKFFDLMVTIPTLLLDNGPGSTKRRSKYGHAGCFRPTPYGIEYRTPSCWWLGSPMLVSLIYGLGRMAWTIMGRSMDEKFREVIKTDEETIRGAIDESDVKTVKKIWDRMMPYLAVIGVPLSNPLHIGSVETTRGDWVRSRYKWTDGPPSLEGKKVHSLAAFEYMLKHGLSSVISDDVKHEWGLNPDSIYKNGLINGSFHKLVDNEDFQKFQTSFVSDLFS